VALQLPGTALLVRGYGEGMSIVTDHDLPVLVPRIIVAV
jgi:hypothetical protein